MTPSRMQLADKQQIMSLVQMNRLFDAKNACVDLSKQHPFDAEVWFMLGALCERLGEYTEAEQFCIKAIKLQPQNAGAHYNYGMVLTRLGKFDKAVRSFHKAIDLRPDFAEAYSDLGNACSASGQNRRAIDAYQQAIRLKPDHVNAHIQLGITLQQAGKHDTALECLQRALQLLQTLDREGSQGIAPIAAKVYFHIGNAHYDRGSFEDADMCYRQALQLSPNDAEVHNNLGNALKSQGLPDDAISEYYTAINLDPMFAAAHVNLGVALRDIQHLDEALAILKKATQLNHDMAEGHHNLANVLQDMHRHTEAESSYRHALQLTPDFAEAEVGLGNALLSQGRAPEAIAHFRNATRIDTRHEVAHSCLLFSLNYVHEETPGAIYDEHVKWGQLHASHPPSARFSNQPDPHRKLRIGYVSPDLRCHSVAFFLKPLLEKHNPGNFEVTCYSEVAHPDETTEYIKSLVNHWRVTTGKSDDAVASMIREDRIDLLIDLAGHTQGNRLPVFGSKPAPVQISWLGYPNTTGVPAIDYRLTDAYADPHGTADMRHTERLIRIPGGFLCYEPPDPCPETGPLPLLSKGHITFGSFNMLAKTNQEIVAHWSSILTALPGSRLIMKTRALQDTRVHDRYRKMFNQQGITSDRVDLVSWTPNIFDHMEIYNRVDIALDPYPYNGTTTTCEALWMGVPVITLEGNCHAGRVGSSLLHAIGMPEFIALTEEEYRRLAIGLANNTDQLRLIRANLREQVASSRLCNSEDHASEIELVFRETWNEWCKKQV